MSSVIIAGNTSGTITLDAPAVAGTTTLTLPTTSGTIVTSASSLTASQLPAGSVLQVVNATYSTQTSSASNTFVDTGLSASITPSSSSNKILVLISLNLYPETSGAQISTQIVRGASAVLSQDYSAWAGTGGYMGNLFFQALDSPSTTSSTTYKMQFKKRSGSGTVYAQWVDGNGTGLSSITLMEIKA
jgi:hypothetical protein